MKRILTLLSIMTLFTKCSKVPGACFTYYPNIIKAGDVVTFNASCSKNGSFFNWSFGDGSADTNTINTSMSHTYIVSGTYQVKLNVRSKGGVTLTKGKPENTITIEVQ